MMQRPRLLLVHLIWEILRLGLLLGLAAAVFNREGHLDSSVLLFLAAAPGLMLPAAVLLLYLEPGNAALRTLLIAGKALMVLAAGAAALVLSVFGMVAARLLSIGFSLRLPPATGIIVLVLFGVDLLFLMHLLLFKPAGTDSDGKSEGVPEPPIVRVEEE